ncbi:MAG: dimethyl sulfoxide reductase anchor subunit family protein [Roseicyclus sp.]
MHPAYSVIFFTTSSGAGYGLWVWLAIRMMTGAAEGAGAMAALVLGGILVTLGLLSSTFHLGHPERAWRAFSQWRTSWLSREGVAAVLTYAPAGWLFLGLVLPGELPGMAFAAALLGLGAVATVWCTGMIYASLRTVPAWNTALVPVVYMALAAATGALLLALIDAVIGTGRGAAWLAAAALLSGAALKVLYWRRIDGAKPRFGIADALGIPGARRIRPLDPPHTQPNFVMREMGYVVARRHARRLRRIALALLFAVPLTATLASAFWPGGAVPLLALASLSASLGVWLERWLFFAEAEHLSMLYYPETRPAEASGA